MTLVKKCIAEFIGTLVLVVFGCGTAVAVGCGVVGGYLITALAFGLVIVAMAYSIGNISGCHINPAVSLAMFINKKLTITEFIGYIISQFTGAIAGSAILLLLFGKEYGFGANTVSEVKLDGDLWKGFIVEIILTFVFVIAIIGVTSKIKNSSVAGVVIGLTLTLVHIFGIALTGTSVNPARSFGPALFAGGDALSQVWIFILAPLVGAALAAVCYKFLAKDISKDE